MLPPGIHYNIPDADYRSDPGISQSDLKAWATQKKFKRGRYLDIGTAFEDLLQRPDSFGSTWGVHEGDPNRRLAETKADERLLMRASGCKGVLKQSEYQLVKAMVESVRADERAAKAISAIRSSQVAIIEEVDGLRTKCLLDELGRGFYLDWKTTSAFDYEMWMESFWRFGYHIQAASYKGMADRALAQNLPFVFGCVSKVPDESGRHPVWFHYTTREQLTAGELHYRDLVAVYRRYEQPQIVESAGNVEVVA